MTDQKKSRTHNSKTMPLSELPYSNLKRLGDRLDLAVDGSSTWWRKLITAKADPRYDMVTVAKLARAGQQPDGSPGYDLLMDLGNRGTTLGELVSLLKKIHYYDALKELNYKEDVKILKHPSATPVMLGQRLQLECKAEGIPTPSYQWFRGRQALQDQCSSTLVIEQVGRNDEGIYACRVMNEANCVFSNWATVQIINPELPESVIVPGEEDVPVIREQPQSQSLEIGQTLFLKCDCVGSGTLDYQWFKDAQPLPYGRHNNITIDSVQVADQGAYSCSVKSSNGTSVLSAVAKVTVSHPHNIAGYSPVHMQTEHIFTPSGPGFTAGDTMFPPPPVRIPPMMSDEQMMLGGYNGGPRYIESGMRMSPSEPSGSGYGQPHLLGPGIGTMAFSNGLPPSYHPQNGIPLPGGLMGSGPHPPPPTTLPHLHHEVTTHFSTSPRIPSPSGAYQYDPEAGGQDTMCCIEKQCSDKVALLIGNKQYHVQNLQLNTPENDCQDLAGILRSADFKVVSLVNLTKREMDDAIDYFMELIGPNVYSLFFFAGHGFEHEQMNYMMAVDCTREKNPQLCVCAQDVLRRMQEGGAKLSIVLLDMCRVSAPQNSMMDPRGIYRPPVPPQTYAGYHVFVFSCSPAEKAFEVFGESDATHEICRISKDNSIFVAALKVHLQVANHTLLESVKALLDGIAEQVFRFRPSGPAGSQWQRPEIRHNLPEDLSLADNIDPNLLQHQRLQRSGRWKNGHSVPHPVVVGSEGGLLALRLQFEAEHSNVLLVKIELLQGCLTETVLEHVKVELVQAKPYKMVLCSHKDLERQFESITLQKCLNNSSLIYRVIPDLQKIINNEVELVVHATFRWREKIMDDGGYVTFRHTIDHTMTPPPLYGRITAHYAQEQRMSAMQEMMSP